MNLYGILPLLGKGRRWILRAWLGSAYGRTESRAFGIWHTKKRHGKRMQPSRAALAGCRLLVRANPRGRNSKKEVS